MVKHIVLARVKNEQERIKLLDMIIELPNQIHYLYDLEAGMDFYRQTNSYDLGFICTFKNREDFIRYTNHPAHVKLRDFLRSIRQEGAMLDFEF